MMHNDFKYYFFDLDGTLLNSSKKITLRTLNLLRSIQEKIILCTGRHWGEIVDYIEFIGLNKENYIIYEDGYYIGLANGENISKADAFDLEEIKKIVDVLNIDSYNVFSENMDYLIENNIWKYIWSMVRRKSSKLQVVRSIEMANKGLNQNFIKINVSNVSNNILKQLKCKYTVHCLENNKIDIMKTNKFFAIKKLCEITDTPLDKVMYFGDSVNDIECFGNLQYAIAMGNAEEEIKKLAYKITNTNDNDGIAEFFENY